MLGSLKRIAAALEAMVVGEEQNQQKNEAQLAGLMKQQADFIAFVRASHQQANDDNEKRWHAYEERQRLHNEQCAEWHRSLMDEGRSHGLAEVKVN